MKAIQVSFDEELLERLDSTKEAKRDGRSAVLRRATAEYLKRHAREEVAARYRRAYGEREGLGDEFEGWEDQGRWPES